MNEKNENQFRLTDFDYLTADPKLQMLKAAIPYLPVSQQRVFSLLVKVQELRVPSLSLTERKSLPWGSPPPRQNQLPPCSFCRSSNPTQARRSGK